MSSLNLVRRLNAKAAGISVDNDRYDLTKALKYLKYPVKYKVYRGQMDKWYGNKLAANYHTVLSTLDVIDLKSTSGGMVRSTANAKFLLRNPIDWGLFISKFDATIGAILGITPESDPEDIQRLSKQAAQKLLYELFRLRLPVTLLKPEHTPDAIADKADEPELEPEKLTIDMLLAEPGAAAAEPEVVAEPEPEPEMQKPPLKSFQELKRERMGLNEMLAKLVVEFDVSRPEAELHDFLYDCGMDPTTEIDFLGRRMKLIKKEYDDKGFVRYRAAGNAKLAVKHGIEIRRDVSTHAWLVDKLQPYYRKERAIIEKVDATPYVDPDPMVYQQLLEKLCQDLTYEYKDYDLDTVLRGMKLRMDVIPKLIYLNIIKRKGLLNEVKLGDQAVETRDADINWRVVNFFRLSKESQQSYITLSKGTAKPSVVVTDVAAAIARAQEPKTTFAPPPLPPTRPAERAHAQPAMQAPVRPQPAPQPAARPEPLVQSIVPSVALNLQQQQQQVSLSSQAINSRLLKVLQIMYADLGNTMAHYDIAHVCRVCQMDTAGSKKLKELGLLNVEIIDEKYAYQLTRMAIDIVENEVDLSDFPTSRTTPMALAKYVKKYKEDMDTYGPPDKRTAAAREEHQWTLAERMQAVFKGERTTDLEAAMKIVATMQKRGMI